MKTENETQWMPSDEITYVRKLGTGKWSAGSNIRHERTWWLRKYLKVTEKREEPFVLAGREEAIRLLIRLK